MGGGGLLRFCKISFYLATKDKDCPPHPTQKEISEAIEERDLGWEKRKQCCSSSGSTVQWNLDSW